MNEYPSAKCLNIATSTLVEHHDKLGECVMPICDTCLATMSKAEPTIESRKMPGSTICKVEFWYDGDGPAGMRLELEPIA